MMRFLLVFARGFGVISLTIGLTAALAQPVKMPDPADPIPATSAGKYESAFSGYQAFREQNLRSWKDANQEVADNPGMGATGTMDGMKGMPGMGSSGSMKDMPGMGSAGSMKDVPKMGTPGSMKDMPGMDAQGGDAPKGNKSKSGHDMGSMKDMTGMGSAGSMKNMPDMNSKVSIASTSEGAHGAMAMVKPSSKVGAGEGASITGTAVVQGVDKGNGKVKLTHDPIDVLGWPKMTMFFRLKDASLAGSLNEGDRVAFTLEKSATGYVISSVQKAAPRP